MAEIRAEGVSRGAVWQRRGPRLPGTLRANKGPRGEEKAPFSSSIKEDSARWGMGAGQR